AIYSTVLFICFSFCLMQIVNVDLSRYQLTALTSLLETFKTSKSEK
ncbi:conjugal transfer entry exclusion protein TraS, partial [Klebsiella pneumoniae]